MSSTRQSAVLPISIVIAALIIGGALVLNERPETTRIEKPPVGDFIDDDVVLGDPNAPVKIILFGDYQCPFCKELFDEHETRLRTEYVETGKALMVYRDFPLDPIHPFARTAAYAAGCAGEQGRYWEYHDMLYRKQSRIPVMNFIEEATALGLSEERFATCLTEDRYVAEVEADYQFGLSLGIRATPTTYINDQRIEGLPQSYQHIRAIIEQELLKKSNQLTE